MALRKRGARDGVEPVSVAAIVVVPQVPPLICRKHPGSSEDGFRGKFRIVIDLDPAFAAHPCGHQYDASGCAGSVYGCRRRILENVDGYDILLLQDIHVAARYTVHDYQGALVGHDGVDAPELDADRGVGIRSGAGIDVEAGNLSGKRKQRRLAVSCNEVLGFQGRDGRCELALFQRAVAYDHDVVQHFVASFKDHLEGLAGYHDLLVVEAQHLENERTSWRHAGKRETAVRIGQGGRRAGVTLDGNEDSGQRLSGVVRHTTFDQAGILRIRPGVFLQDDLIVADGVPDAGSLQDLVQYLIDTGVFDVKGNGALEAGDVAEEESVVSGSLYLLQYAPYVLVADAQVDLGGQLGGNGKNQNSRKQQLFAESKH